MKKVVSPSPDELRYAGRPCVFAFFILMIPCGFAVALAIAFRSNPLEDPRYPAMAAACIFILMLCALFFRTTVRLNRSTRTVTSGYSVWVTLYRTDKTWSDQAWVSLRRERRSTGKSSYDAYVLRIGDPGGNIDFREFRDEIESRTEAKYLALFTKLPFFDEIANPPVRHSLEELTDPRPPLERLRAIFEALSPPPKPAGTRLKIRRTEAGIHATIPALKPTFWMFLFGGMLAFCAFNLWMLVFLQGPKAPPFAGRFVIAAFALVITGLGGTMLIAALRRPFSPSFVEASPAELKSTEAFVLYDSTVLAAKDLHELNVEYASRDAEIAGNALCMSALGEKSLLRFGFNLNRAELEWLRYFLLAAILDRLDRVSFDSNKEAQ